MRVLAANPPFSPLHSPHGFMVTAPLPKFSSRERSRRLRRQGLSQLKRSGLVTSTRPISSYQGVCECCLSRRFLLRISQMNLEEYKNRLCTSFFLSEHTMSLAESGLKKLSDRRQELVTYCLSKSYRTNRISSRAFSLLLQCNTCTPNLLTNALPNIFPYKLASN